MKNRKVQADQVLFMSNELLMYVFERFGFQDALDVAFLSARVNIGTLINIRCREAIESLDFDLKRIRERSERLYFDFCCHTGICCPSCGGSWNREAKTSSQDTFWCQLCFYEWPRTGKIGNSPWLVISPRTQKNM